MKRRTRQEIREVNQICYTTMDVAVEISSLVNGEDDSPSTYVHVNPYNIEDVKAEHQRELADLLEVSFDTKDPYLAERVARAIKNELKLYHQEKPQKEGAE